jgi:hypothetical protein
VGKPAGKRQLGRPGRGWEVNIKMRHRESGLIWSRIGTSGELLLTRQRIFGFHKTLGNSEMFEQLVAS